jgi:glycosyltransferase involved in cell wall biosynthesis
MKKISIITPTFNEVDNIEKLCKEVSIQMKKLNYDYEHLIIDNSSTDGTIELIKKITNNDKKVKAIINSKNFGDRRSPMYGILQADGDACITISADFQDPIDLIPQYIEKWENGSKIILSQKSGSDENQNIFYIRKIFYLILNKISSNKLTINTTGTGLFDRSIVNQLKKIKDPTPYLRGLVTELTDQIDTVKYHQPLREKGISKSTLFHLYDIAMLGVVKMSKTPLRIATIIGFIASLISFTVAIIYLFYKLIFWDSFSLGTAPLVIGLFALSSIQIFIIGLVGEYVGVILDHQRNLPLVIEKERINFD